MSGKVGSTVVVKQLRNRLGGQQHSCHGERPVPTPALAPSGNAQDREKGRTGEDSERDTRGRQMAQL